MNPVERIISSQRCVGCGLCASVGEEEAVVMAYDPQGFLRPSGTERLSAGKISEILSACRGIHSDYVRDTSSSRHEGQSHDPLWGSYYQCGVGHATDEDLRYRASSGGALSAVAKYLIDSGKADWVLATDYSTEDAVKTVVRVVTTPDDVGALTGSKYAPAAPLESLAKAMRMEGRGVVIGRPCDISTVRLHLESNPHLKSRVVALLSFFCAGTPSDHANSALLNKIGVGDRRDIAEFRHRGDGWPGFAKATLKDGTVQRCTYAEAWGDVLAKDLQFACKICADGVGEAADIVFADAWYGDENGYPDFDEAEGRSLILSRSQAGQALLAEARAAGVLKMQRLDTREIDSMQPGQLRRRRFLAIRLLAMRMLLRPTPRYNKRALRDYQQGVPLRSKLQALGGTVLRVLKR